MTGHDWLSSIFPFPSAPKPQVNTSPLDVTHAQWHIPTLTLMTL
eukprot:CAMPEP_0119139826 /NCGR_PEP_ID=MMETSP1310-20130426/28194_1 /TAXON_ID=464262 /ORGANISM="Genus nov. species nov., Strain RCC2339" /LENGTH=43 /DNA_ID= /DNA_START= /DNA_END= /DNA_ORIENTATION=